MCITPFENPGQRACTDILTQESSGRPTSGAAYKPAPVINWPSGLQAQQVRRWPQTGSSASRSSVRTGSAVQTPSGIHRSSGNLAEPGAVSDRHHIAVDLIGPEAKTLIRRTATVLAGSGPHAHACMAAVKQLDQSSTPRLTTWLTRDLF